MNFGLRSTILGVPRLIHLNGPPGIGKSTLAQLYVDQHPGVLNLDIDQLRPLIGGWQQRFAETGALVRPIALSVARTHLRAGYDVVMPQYLGKLPEIERFEAAARDAGAVFCEVLLMDSKERSIERFASRDSTPRLHRQVQEVVERSGGSALLAAMHDALAEVVSARSNVVVIPSIPGEVGRTYAALTAVLDSQV